MTKKAYMLQEITQQKCIINLLFIAIASTTNKYSYDDLKARLDNTEKEYRAEINKYNELVKEVK